MLIKSDRKVLGVPIDNGATSYHRVIQPLYELMQQGHPVQFLGPQEEQPEQYKWAEILYIQCLYAPDAYKFYAEQKKQGKKIIIDFDDDYINIPPDSPEQTEVIDKNTGEVFRYPTYMRSLFVQMFIQLADIVIVTTDALKQLYSPWAKDIRVIPNCVSPEMKRDKPKTDNNKVRILWSGSNSHLPDLKILQEPITKIWKKYQDKVEFHFQGGLNFKELFSDIPVVEHPQVSFGDYLNLIQDINADISLAPLQRNQFNLSKSNLKYLQMTLMESVFVASNYGPYTSLDDGEDGFLCKSPEDWISKLDLLINNSELRKKVSKNAMSYVDRCFMLDKHLPRWKALLAY